MEESFKFNCIVKTLPLEFCEDFVKKSCWDLFICSKSNLNSSMKFLGDQEPIEMSDSSGEETLSILESSLKNLMKSNKQDN